MTFAQVLSRHGSRAPTKGKRDKYKKVVDRIQKSVTNLGHGYEFIQSYSFNLGSNDLTLFGEKELVKSGETFYQRYKDLSSDSHPFIRAAGSDRVIRSAQNFTQGFYKLQGKDAASHIAEILVISEEVGANNTLNHGGCSAFEDGPLSELSDEIQDTWMNIWVPPIMQRLNEKMLGANLTLQETIYMMDLCPFNTIATPNATISDFCRLFSQGEWRSYDYYQSLGKWYGHGQGNALGPTQGVGFANELISRLTGSPVNDHTSTNSTLDTSPITFPLNKTLYADFSHDNDMTSIYAALGLYNTTEDLPVKYKISPVKAKGYSAAWTVPFAGRMYVEKMVCKSGGKTGEELVRVLVNDRVLPLLGCGADRLGRCRLSAFVKSLSFAQSGGHWDQCFACSRQHHIPVARFVDEDHVARQVMDGNGD